MLQTAPSERDQQSAFYRFQKLLERDAEVTPTEKEFRETLKNLDESKLAKALLEIAELCPISLQKNPEPATQAFHPFGRIAIVEMLSRPDPGGVFYWLRQELKQRRDLDLPSDGLDARLVALVPKKEEAPKQIPPENHKFIDWFAEGIGQRDYFNLKWYSNTDRNPEAIPSRANLQLLLEVGAVQGSVENFRWVLKNLAYISLNPNLNKVEAEHRIDPKQVREVILIVMKGALRHGLKDPIFRGLRHDLHLEKNGALFKEVLLDAFPDPSQKESLNRLLTFTAADQKQIDREKAARQREAGWINQVKRPASERLLRLLVEGDANVLKEIPDEDYADALFELAEQQLELAHRLNASSEKTKQGKLQKEIPSLSPEEIDELKKETRHLQEHGAQFIDAILSKSALHVLPQYAHKKIQGIFIVLREKIASSANSEFLYNSLAHFDRNAMESWLGKVQGFNVRLYPKGKKEEYYEAELNALWPHSQAWGTRSDIVYALLDLATRHAEIMAKIGPYKKTISSELQNPQQRDWADKIKGVGVTISRAAVNNPESDRIFGDIANELQRRVEVGLLSPKEKDALKDSLTQFLGVTLPPSRGAVYEPSERDKARYQAALQAKDEVKPILKRFEEKLNQLAHDLRKAERSPAPSTPPIEIPRPALPFAHQSQADLVQ